jgi:hypothetical protein
VYTTLWDDKLLGVTSVTQLTVNVPEHFINGGNTALAYGQVIEATVQEMKEWQRHLFNGDHRIHELMRRFWGSLYAEGEDVAGIDRRVAGILKHHADSIEEHNVNLDRAIVLLNYLKVAFRSDKAETVIDAIKTLNKANVSERRAQKMYDDINYALNLTGDVNMQPWNLWRQVSPSGTASTVAAGRASRSATAPAAAAAAVSTAPVPADFKSPYQAVEKVGIGTSRAKLTEITRIAQQELADLETSLQQPGVRNMLSVWSLGQRAYFQTTNGVKRDYYCKPYGPKIPEAAIVSDTSDEDEARLQELFLTGDIGAPREEIDRVFGSETVRLRSAPRRQGRRDMLRGRQEALRGTEIVAVPESTSAPKIFCEVKTGLKDDHTPIGDAPNRTALFYCDMSGEEATYRVGVLEMKAEYLDPDAAMPRQYTVTELQVRQNSSFSAINKRHRSQMKTLYDADTYEIAACVIGDVPDTEVSYKCVVRIDIDHGTYKIKAADRQAAHQAETEHIEWQDEQERMAAARREVEAAARLAAAEAVAGVAAASNASE